MNHYTVLGLPFGASTEEIREAYFAAARILHPDVNPDPGVREEFLKVQQSYEILSDVKSRRAYDRKLTPEDKITPISMDIQFSRPAVRRMFEPQLIYALLTFANTIEPRPEDIPPRHLCLVIDRSTSMQGKRIEVVKANILQLIKTLNPLDQISVVTFSDRATLVIPRSKITNLRMYQNRIRAIETGGGTEILHGLQMGLEELRQTDQTEASSQLILLTDGHTYGDEQGCLDLARLSLKEKIVISALGIGGEWNDDFLDRLTALSGGSTVYVSSTDDLAKHMAQKIDYSKLSYARGMKFDFNKDNAVTLRFAFRLYPEVTPLPVDTNPLYFGNLPVKGSLSILLEYIIEDTGKLGEYIRLGSGFIEYDPIMHQESRRLFLSMKHPIRDVVEKEAPPPAILNAMSRLTLYRMQERAREEVKAGDLSSAKQHLKKLATNLLSQGNSDLARVVLNEVKHLEETRHYSDDGDKRIKYGTRFLLLPSGWEK